MRSSFLFRCNEGELNGTRSRVTEGEGDRLRLLVGRPRNRQIGDFGGAHVRRRVRVLLGIRQRRFVRQRRGVFFREGIWRLRQVGYLVWFSLYRRQRGASNISVFNRLRAVSIKLTRYIVDNNHRLKESAHIIKRMDVVAFQPRQHVVAIFRIVIGRIFKIGCHDVFKNRRARHEEYRPISNLQYRVGAPAYLYA